MSKYNHTKSIPIKSISERRIKRAIHEWSEGDDSMERLLWACYERGIETSGCHAGSQPWIEFNYQEGVNRLACLMDVTQNIVGSQVLISVDGGNPFSGPEWDLSTISIGIDTEYQDEADIYFDNLIAALEKNLVEDSHPMLDLLNFFVNKESGLLFRFRHDKNNKFVFYIESRRVIDERYNYYNDLFTKAGFIEIENKNIDCKRHNWKIEDNNINSILNKLEKAKNIIIDNYLLEIETDENKIIDFILKTRFKKKNLTEKKFNKWLKQERKGLFNREKI